MRPLVAALAAVILAACATTQGTFRPLATATYPPKPADFAVEVFESGEPSRAYERIARLDAHFEKTHLISTSLATAIEELKKQARAAGADAIIDIREQRSRVGETLILHVTATGVRYR